MKRLQFIALAGFFLLCFGTFNSVYSNSSEVVNETPDFNEQFEEEAYSRESVLSDDLDSEYEEPKSDDVIASDLEENEDDSTNVEMTDEGEEG